MLPVMTIVERANSIYPEDWHMEKMSYIKGAEEQQKIDIEKACKWLKEHFNIILDEDKENGVALCECPFTEEMEDAFRKTMEEER